MTILNIKKGHRKIKACFSWLKIPSMYTTVLVQEDPSREGTGRDGNVSPPPNISEQFSRCGKEQRCHMAGQRGK